VSYLLSYYGDDFTGSTDVMEALTLGGVPTILFLQPPSKAQLATFPKAQAIGIAGTSRAMTPENMDKYLPNMFAKLGELKADFCHYKVCSTFDSSPTLGSIGRAIELGLEAFSQAFVPLIVGAPILKRYVIFGNLFATVDGKPYRLDRHPTMSQHPSTPMTESELGRHLAQQTELSVSNVDVLTLAQGALMTIEQAKAANTDIVLFDTVTEAHLETLGEVLTCLKDQGFQFLAGSSGAEYALIAYLHKQAKLSPVKILASVPKVEQIIVVSGSAAPPTAKQIAEAAEHGFSPIRMNAPKLIDPNHQTEEIARLKQLASEALERGQSPLLYSVLGPADSALAETKDALRKLGYAASDASHLLGTQQGLLLRDLLLSSGIRRACIAGGDTCGYVAKQLGIYALELLKPIAPGSPLCRAYSENKEIDGLELSLKAGQVGQKDYFITVRDGL